MNNQPQEFSGLTVSNNFIKTLDRPTRISARELHKYVWGLIGIFILIAITYPIAMDRVARQSKFAVSKSHLKSLTLDYKPMMVGKDLDRSN